MNVLKVKRSCVLLHKWIELCMVVNGFQFYFLPRKTFDAIEENRKCKVHINFSHHFFVQSSTVVKV